MVMYQTDKEREKYDEWWPDLKCEAQKTDWFSTKITILMMMMMMMMTMMF